MTDGPILFVTLPGEPPMAFVEAMPDWDAFDELIEYLVEHYSAEIAERIDGPDARRWVLKVRDQEFELWHDDVAGNSLVATKPGAEELIRKIATDLESRLTSGESE